MHHFKLRTQGRASNRCIPSDLEENYVHCVSLSLLSKPTEKLGIYSKVKLKRFVQDHTHTKKKTTVKEQLGIKSSPTQVLTKLKFLLYLTKREKKKKKTFETLSQINAKIHPTLQN